MLKIFTLALLGATIPALATTYTVPHGSSAAAIQTIVNTAGAAPGNTVVFSAGSYSLDATITLPCSNATIYTGPNVGMVNQSNLPVAVLTSTVPTTYAVSTDSNSTSLTGGQGCTIEYLRFSGTQGGILVYYPASGIIIQQNAFDNNNPPAGGASSEASIYLTGQNAGFSATTGVQYISILWNTFFDNCAAIRAFVWPDSGGGCAATWVNGYNNHLVWSNNTINLTEEGLKLSEQTSLGISSLNAEVENNNMQGNSRIMIESQQDTNGSAVYSHNSFYQPNDPSYNTFELSIPEYTPSVSPTHAASDNVYIGNVPVTATGSGAHYGIGLELWGAGSIATDSLFQGGNGADTCNAGWGCSGWLICVGEAFTNATITGNYFSGTDVWSGTAGDVGNAITYEDNASSANPGLTIGSNTVVQTSTTIPTVAPAISLVPASTGATVTLTDADSSHGLSMFYTTNGTTPAIFIPGGSAGTSHLYTAPFTVPSGITIKAIASWGQGANQGIAFPSFGYVPSSVVTAVVSPAQRTVTSAYLGQQANANTMNAGGTLQFNAYAVYSDGSVGALPDAEGNSVTAWNTNNHAVAKVSTGGHVTAMTKGEVEVQATVGAIKSSPWAVTVNSATPAPGAAVQADSLPAAAPAAAQSPAVDGGSGAAAPAAVVQPGLAAAPVPASVTASPGPMPAPPGAALPDSFVGPFWKLVTPGGGSASISNSHLFLGVPGGANHDTLSPSNQAVRVVQAIGNQDFDVAIKIDSLILATDGNTNQGLMVLADSQDFITFALATDGTKIGLAARTVTQGVASTVLYDADFSQYQNPMYLRLSRAGSAYAAYYSLDGVDWTQTTSFTYTMLPTSVGPFASNYSDTPANASPVVMSVNWMDVLR
jgi:hypothetical protein